MLDYKMRERERKWYQCMGISIRNNNNAMDCNPETLQPPLKEFQAPWFAAIFYDVTLQF